MNSSTVPISDYPAAEDLLCASPLSPSPASPDTTPQPGEAGEAMAPPAPVPWSHRAGSALPTDDSPSAAANLGSYLSRHKLGLQMNQWNRVAKIGHTLYTTRRLCGAHVCQLPQFCVGHTIFCKMQKKYSSTSSSLFRGLLLEERERDLAFASRCLFSNSFSSLSILRQACFRRCRRAPFPFVM